MCSKRTRPKPPRLRMSHGDPRHGLSPAVDDSLWISVAGLVSVRLEGVRSLGGETGHWVRTVLGRARGEIADLLERLAREPERRPALRDEIASSESSGPSIPSTSIQLKARSEAIVALMSLGYSRATAEQSLRKVLSESLDKNLAVEEMIKLALRHAAK